MKSIPSLARISILASVLFCFTAHAAKFEISLPNNFTNSPEGRLILILGKTNRTEMRFAIEDADARGPFAFGVDVKSTTRKPIIVDDTATACLSGKLSQ